MCGTLSSGCTFSSLPTSEVQSGIMPPLFFVPILLAVITNLKNPSSEEAVAANNKHCQGRANTFPLLIPTRFLSG